MISSLYIGLLLAAAPTATVFDYSPASPNGVQIDGYLTRKKSPLAGLGESFSTYGRDYNVDPRLIVAIAGAETTFASRVCVEKNAWNWFYGRNCPQSPFASYEAGLERVSRFMRLSYLNRGYDSVELIRYKYCATGCENWVHLVSTFQAEMPANSAPSAPASPPSTPVTKAPSGVVPPAVTAPDPRSGIRILGLPPFVLFFAAALLVGAWATRSLKS